MKSLIPIVILLILLSCTNQEELPILKTSSKTISIKDGNKLHKEAWEISSDIEVDEFITQKFQGEKKVLFISDIDTLTFNVSPNNTYDFVVQLNTQKAFTRINTDTLKEATFQPKHALNYYYDNKNHIALTDTIPFTLKDHLIYLKGTINNSKSLDFLFDTGANAIVIVSKLIGKTVNLKLDGTIENEGFDGKHTTATSSSNKLELKNLNWDNVKLLSIDYQNPSFDAVLGWVAFENKIIEIDYEKKILVIHKSMETVSKDFSKIETKMIGGIPYLKGKISVSQTESTGWFEYDSGSNGSFLLSQKFANKNNLNGKLKIIGTSISSGSAGIEWKSNDVILPKLQFGDFELFNLPMSINEKDPVGIENNDILGNNLLKRFNAIIDFKNFEIYLKPNSLFSMEY